MAKLLDSLGFIDNPFTSYSAENEPAIDQYFIRPPYYDAVTEKGRAARSLVLFGARGAGKSATRLTFYKNAWADWHPCHGQHEAYSDSGSLRRPHRSTES
jgi:hypothetical protein